MSSATGPLTRLQDYKVIEQNFVYLITIILSMATTIDYIVTYFECLVLTKIHRDMTYNTFKYFQTS